MIDYVKSLLCMWFYGCQARIESVRAMLTVFFKKYVWKLKSVRSMRWNKVQGFRI